MGYTEPKTWAYKEALSDDDLNIYVRDNFIALIDRFCPVGSIREFGVATNPASLMGFGTWELYGVGQTTVCINSADATFNTLGANVGSKTSNHRHTGPSHRHTIVHWHRVTRLAEQTDGAGLNQAEDYRGRTMDQDTNYSEYDGTGYTSYDAPSVIQPSKVVYRWIRTA